jgi:mRNA-degrading endonuclease RelE of RelBE toxin-antitoxin system
MKHLAVSKHFQKQLKKLPKGDQRRVAEKLKDFLLYLSKKKIPLGYGFKKINGDKYELRGDLKIRVVMKNEGDTLVCHAVGNHDEVKRYLRKYRNK